MSEKTHIKVIKRDDAAKRPGKPPRKDPNKLAARELVATVTGWVRDVKEKKAADTRSAIDRLFKGPSPSES